MCITRALLLLLLLLLLISTSIAKYKHENASRAIAYNYIHTYIHMAIYRPHVYYVSATTYIHILYTIAAATAIAAPQPPQIGKYNSLFAFVYNSGVCFFVAPFSFNAAVLALNT